MTLFLVTEPPQDTSVVNDTAEQNPYSDYQIDMSGMDEYGDNYDE